MKKALALILALAMMFSALPVFASENAEEVLLAIKSKIDIDKDLTKFHYSENMYEDILRYDFMWSNEDATKEVNISADSRGRLVNYNYYEFSERNYDRILIEYTIDDALVLADAFVKKAFGEYFDGGDDVLVVNEALSRSSYSGWNKTFIIHYDRVYKGISVSANRVTVRVRALKDKIYIQSVSASLDEDGTFTEGEDVFAEREEKYEEKFPIRLFYASDYNNGEKEVSLYYSIDKGYVSYLTGEIAVEEYFSRFASMEMSEDSAAMGGMNYKNEGLTPEEQGEIEKMDSLVKSEKIEMVLRALPLLKMTDDMKITETYTYKNNDDYFINLTFKGDVRYLGVTYNGVTGEIRNINTYFTQFDEVDDDEKEETLTPAPENEINEFVEALAGSKVNECKGEYTSSGTRWNYNLDRYVNDIVYYENGIDVTYDTKTGIITRYYLNWDKDVSTFPKVSDAIGVDKAREIVFEAAPADDVYVNTKDGYVKAVTIKEDVTINALTGLDRYEKAEEKTLYSDVEGHWAEEIINILWEHDIYVTGDKFTPDEGINQADMLRLFTACRNEGIIPLRYSDKEVISVGFNAGYIEAVEPEKIMTRLEGFETFCKVIGYGEVAAFDIYKTSYADLEANGSAEILKAMGILTGDTARGSDKLTYAEAAVMVYRFLVR